MYGVNVGRELSVMSPRVLNDLEIRKRRNQQGK